MMVTKQDYLLMGLEAPTLNCTISGTGHFAHNIVPSWYFLDEVELVAGEACMAFRPTENVPNELRKVCDHCNISVLPHKDFMLIVREVVNSTSRYVLLTCRVKDGEIFFHYDVLQKAVIAEVEEKGSIRPDTTVKTLVESGYIIISSADSKSPNFFAVILDHNEAA
jgi:hypothetical protein